MSQHKTEFDWVDESEEGPAPLVREGRSLQFRVFADAKAQGSMKHIGQGRMIHSSGLVAWRHLVATVCRNEMSKGHREGEALSVIAKSVGRGLGRVEFCPELPVPDEKIQAVIEGIRDVKPGGIVPVPSLDSIRPLERSGDWEKLDGPLKMSLVFFRKPPRSPKWKGEGVADTAPDLDKLCRAIGDALEGIAYTNDSRIVELHACKRFGPAGVAIRLIELIELANPKASS